MACDFSVNDVIRYKDKELSQKRNGAFEEHLESCEKCRTALKLLEQMESYAKESAAPKQDIAEATVSQIKQELPESKSSRRKRLNFKRFALPVFGVVLIAISLFAFRQALITGLGSLIGSKYSTQNPGMAAGNAPDQNQTAEEPGITSVPVAVPDTKPAEGSLFAIYKSSVSMDEIYDKYTDGSLPQDDMPYAVPYDSVLIDQIPLDDKPLLTDADIGAYYDGTMIFKCKDAGSLDYFYYGYVSVQPLPIVIEIDGKRVAWGAFMSPISSLSPPYKAFWLGLYPLGGPGSDGSYFFLSTSEAERLTKIEGLISQVFAYAGKLADKSEAPSDLTDIQIIEQGSGPQNPTVVGSNPEYVQTLDLTNLNDPGNNSVSLGLPEGWYATRNDYAIDPSFSFKSPRNSGIRSLTDFTVYAPGVIADTWTPSGPGAYSGTLGIRGRYGEDTTFNNHCSMVKQLYEGESALGPARIYLMDNDIPRDMQKVGQTTYYSVYAWIPIGGEDLAYCLEISVPQGQDYEKTYENVLIILGVKDQGYSPSVKGTP